MATNTLISWTCSTFNAWWGCTKVSPGCDNCYAEALDKRTGGCYWGPHTVPRTLSDANWKQPLQWQRKAEKSGSRRKVFCGSMSDVFDNNAPAGQRERLWDLIKQTPMLDWQLLTKRAANIEKYLPADWGNGYGNVWLGVSVEDKKYGIPRIDILRSIPATIRFISAEPLLEDLGSLELKGIHWIIAGGESGNRARLMDIEWVENLHRQSIEAGVPFFYKQFGGKRNKGNCLLNGKEVKEFPSICPPN